MGTVSMDGLASGLDTTSIIDSLLAVSGAQLSVLKAKKSDIELKKSHWQTFNTYLSNLQNTIEEMNDEDEFKEMSVSSSDETKATATVTGTALAGNYSVDISQMASSQITKSTTTWASGDTAFTANTAEISFSINGGSAQTVSISTNTLDGAISAINDADLGIYAYKVLNTSDEYVLVLAGEDTGADYDFTITPPADVSFEASNTSEALDTLATVNGISVSSSTLELTGSIPGVTLTVADETTSAIEILVSTDTSGIKDNIKTFVDDYNTVMSYVSYEVEVNDSTEEAGPLAGDNTLRSIQRTLQNLMSDSYTSNTINSSALLGISTDSDGTLSIDDDELSDAMNDYFSEVIDYFTSSSGLFEAFTNTSEDGKLDIILDSSDGTITEKIGTLDDQIDDLEESIEDETSRLAKLEETLRKKFTALEVALATLKSTEQYVASALGNNSSSN